MEPSAVAAIGSMVGGSERYDKGTKAANYATSNGSSKIVPVGRNTATTRARATQAATVFALDKTLLQHPRSAPTDYATLKATKTAKSSVALPMPFAPTTEIATVCVSLAVFTVATCCIHPPRSAVTPSFRLT